jgi:phage shock protein C
MRSRTDSMVAGVAGGIAQYLAVDPTLVRLTFVVLFFTGVGVVLYPILWLVMPLEGQGTDAPGAAFDEMRRQAVRFGGEVREVFVASGPARKPRFDPMTGEPLEPEAEIPINNVGASSGASSSAAERRNQLLGLALIGVGAFILLNLLFGPAFGRLLLPLLLVAGGILVLRRS